MQQGAMAQYGDWGGVGLAAKPNLPPINAKYDVAIEDDGQSNNDAVPSSDSQKVVESNLNPNVNPNVNQNVNQNVVQSDNVNAQNAEQAPSEPVLSGKQIEIGTVDSTNSLKSVLEEHCSSHQHLKAKFKVFGHELTTKMTADSKNGKLYIAMISKHSEMLNARQQESLQELVTLLDRQAAAKRKGI